MDLQNVLNKKHRNDLVDEAAAVLESGYSFIAEQGLETRMNDIAIGHMMKTSGRTAMILGLTEKTVNEIDKLFVIMGLRALDTFTLHSQSIALAKTMRGENRGGLETLPELTKLLEKRVKLTTQTEAIQQKIVNATLKKKSVRALTTQRKKKEKELHAIAIEIDRVTSVSTNVSRAF